MTCRVDRYNLLNAIDRGLFSQSKQALIAIVEQLKSMRPQDTQ